MAIEHIDHAVPRSVVGVFDLTGSASRGLAARLVPPDSVPARFAIFSEAMPRTSSIVSEAFSAMPEAASPNFSVIPFPPGEAP